VGGGERGRYREIDFGIEEDIICTVVI